MDGNLAKDTVMLVCGMSGDAICMALWTEMYLKNDMNVLVIDRRGIGKDKEGQLTYGYKERYDLEACVDYLKTKIGAMCYYVGLYIDIRKKNRWLEEAKKRVSTTIENTKENDLE